MINKSLIIILFLHFLTLTGIGQQNTDSLHIAMQLEQDTESKIHMLLDLVAELKINNLKAALPFAQQALDLSITTDYTDGKLLALNELSDIYNEKTDLIKAMDFAMEAKELAIETNNKEQELKALFTISIIYTKLGIYEESSGLLYECLLLSEQIDNWLMKVKTLNSIGIIYHHQKNYDKALEYYLKALVLAREIGYTAGISKGLNNVAAIYGEMGENYPKVPQYIREAITLNKEQHNLEMLGVNYLNLGYYFQEQKKYDSALFYYNGALKIYHEQNNTASIISTKIFLAEYYLELGILKKSKQFALESLEDSRSNKLKQFIYETASLLSEIYFQQQDTLQALRYENLELRMKDSLNIEESQTRIWKLEFQYEIEKVEQEKQIEQDRKDLINIIIFISLIFIIVVVILLLKQMRIKAHAVKMENDKLETDLEISSKELTTNAMLIIKKNKTLLRIAKKMKTIQGEAVKSETKIAIRRIANELNKVAEDEHWEEFELRFKQTHKEFYNKLLLMFPDLTPQEQRLCALLRLNMTTKEISELTGQQTATIEMARTRLRKKLHITNTQTNLITFLTKI